MPISIPAAVAVARIKSGYSMRALARQAALNVATVSHLEKEPRKVSPRTAYLVCQALNKPFDELFIVEPEAGAVAAPVASPSGGTEAAR